jgi:hypothetical protein
VVVGPVRGESVWDGWGEMWAQTYRDAAHVAQDDRDGADCGDVVASVGRGEVVDVVFDCIGDQPGGVDGLDERGRGGVREVIEM